MLENQPEIEILLKRPDNTLSTIWRGKQKDKVVRDDVLATVLLDPTDDVIAWSYSFA